jgi:signal transduction histidine kinase
MNLRRATILFNTGLVILTVVLLIATFRLNRRQYVASITAVETSFKEELTKRSKNLLQNIEVQEAKALALFQTSRVLKADLFIVEKERVVPACVASLLEKQVSKQEAEQAYEKGLAAALDRDALLSFQLASKRAVDTPDDLYRKVSAHFQMLELRYDDQIVCSILAMLDANHNLTDVSLSSSQKQFFRSLLAEQVPDLEKISMHTSMLWKTAREIDQKLVRHKGAFRSVIDGKTLSVRENGLAVLYEPKVETISSVQSTNTKPPGLYEEVVPGLFISIPQSTLKNAKKKILQQYWRGNSILALMLLLGCGLAGGIFVSTRRQRELDAMKTEFVATVSHELRTPLSLVRLHAETLHLGRLSPEKVSDYHQTILIEAERLTGIVNNVLDFSRMQRKKLKIHPTPSDLSSLCEHTIDSFRFRLEREGFQLEKKIEPGVVALADPLAFSQILFNLMDNALKYSDEEKSIRIELERSGNKTILRIADRGIGIPDRMKKKIFDDFVRSTDSKVTARRGSGIGLSVALRLTEEMKGSIEVTDNIPSGSVFSITLRGSDENTGG